MIALIKDLMSSPAGAFIIFIVMGGLLLLFGKKHAAKGIESEGKTMHYSCGEDLGTPSFSLNYHRFFKLALLFGILHIAALMISTIPSVSVNVILPIVYLLGIGATMAILL